MTGGEFEATSESTQNNNMDNTVISNQQLDDSYVEQQVLSSSLLYRKIV